MRIRNLMKFIGVAAAAVVAMLGREFTLPFSRPENQLANGDQDAFPTIKLDKSILSSDKSDINCTYYRLNQTMLSSIYSDYHVVGNVPVECAEIILVGEAHRTSEQQALLKKYIPHLSRKGDLLLLEGHESLKTAPCVVQNEQSQNITLTNDLACIGWDDESIINGIKAKLVSVGDKYNKIFANQFANSPRKILKGLKGLSRYNQSGYLISLLRNEELIAMEDIIKQPKESIFDKVKNTLGYRLLHIIVYKDLNEAMYIYEEYCRLFGAENINNFNNEVRAAQETLNNKEIAIVDRNKYMIKTLQTLQCGKSQPDCHRKLVLTGRGHLFDAPLAETETDLKTGKKKTYFPGVANSDEFLFNQMNKRNKTSPAAELRDFLDTQAYIMLCPKFK